MDHDIPNLSIEERRRGCLRQIGGLLYVENFPLVKLAQQFLTPCYVYSKKAFLDGLQELQTALETDEQVKYQIRFAVKSCPNLTILNLLASQGCGFDIVSKGELLRVCKAGGKASQCVFSGVGKTHEEIKTALELGIGCLNVESHAELKKVEQIAMQLRTKACVSIRLNPNIDADTHHHITTGLKSSKFGIEKSHIGTLYPYICDNPHLTCLGLACHIGSQITNLDKLVNMYGEILGVAKSLEKQGYPVQHLNIGGGVGICYHHENPPQPGAWAKEIRNVFASTPYKITLEPGRILSGPAGFLLCKVTYIKKTSHKNFAVVDAAMNDLIRPALYQAWHDVIPARTQKMEPINYDIVGPVCETTDVLAKDRKLAIQEGDLLAIANTGAYGSSMASNYTSRPLPPEIFVDGKNAEFIRLPASPEDLWIAEPIPPPR